MVNFEDTGSTNIPFNFGVLIKTLIPDIDFSTNKFAQSGFAFLFLMRNYLALSSESYQFTELLAL